jgi:hypothetical protein
MCTSNCGTSAQNYCDGIYGGGGGGGGGGQPGPHPGPSPGPRPYSKPTPKSQQQFLEKDEGKAVATIAAVGGPLLAAWLLALVL